MRKNSWVATRALWLGLSLLGVVSAGALGCGDDGKDDGLGGQSGDLKNHGKGKDAAVKPVPVDAELPPAPTDAAAELDPCTLAHCAADERCELKQVQCIRAPCPPIASCVPAGPTPDDAGLDVPGCAAVLCAVGTTCVDGPKGASCVASDDGCKDTKCDDGSHCELEDVVCVRAPCLPVPHCVVDPDACATVKCMGGTHCQIKNVQCFVAPCPEIPECVSN